METQSHFKYILSKGREINGLKKICLSVWFCSRSSIYVNINKSDRIDDDRGMLSMSCKQFETKTSSPNLKRNWVKKKKPRKPWRRWHKRRRTSPLSDLQAKEINQEQRLPALNQFTGHDWSHSSPVHQLTRNEKRLDNKQRRQPNNQRDGLL
jgi:hypothetical protein